VCVYNKNIIKMKQNIHINIKKSIKNKVCVFMCVMHMIVLCTFVYVLVISPFSCIEYTHTHTCTRIPSTLGLSFSFFTIAIMSACVALAGTLYCLDSTPTSLHARVFIRTYVCESLRAPTNITARVGRSFCC